MADAGVVRGALAAASVKAKASQMRFALMVAKRADRDAIAEALEQDLADFSAAVERRSPDELLLVLNDRQLADETAAFRAAGVLVAEYGLEAAEPEIFFTAMPVDMPSGEPVAAVEEGVSELLGCWAPEEPALNNRKRWALEAMRLQQAWDFAASRGRPSRGEGIVVAQPDTGITAHQELAGITFVAQRNLIGLPRDNATDPLSGGGNPGHGTSTSSVLASPESLEISGTAPLAKVMPIRAIESVVRLSQIKVAEAIDYAVDNGAHVITMSLGGIASFSLWRALSRAVDAGVIVVAAAGNCVGVVVWPARYDKCIAVAGVDSADRPWVGSSRGSTVDISAPGQNVFRASAPNNGVAQGQGTSYAVALTAGVAACWLAFHGRSVVATEARARNETVQAMFRRLVRATARVPDDWDSFNFGAGVVDAEALLKADFDFGIGTESPTPSVVLESAATSVRSLALEKLGPRALGADLNWGTHGAEISLALLRNTLPKQPKGKAAPARQLESLVRPAPPPNKDRGPKSPAVRRSPGNLPLPESIARQKRIIATRAAIEEGGGSLESARAGGSQIDDAEPLSKRAAKDTLDRVLALASRMPAREVRDRRAFESALTLLAERGGRALQKLTNAELAVDAGVTRGDSAVLEAIIIADGSRPSFLLENGLPPLEHPFIGTWSDELTAARAKLAALSAAVGRIQPRFGHAGNYIGTGCLVDAANGIILTNYHVLDDARRVFGVLMEKQGDVVKIHGDLEIDFLAEAESVTERRFRIVEARLPKQAGANFGRLDAVTMVIEPIDAADMPAAIAFSRSMTVLNQAASMSFCTIGFPGPPSQNPDQKGDVDWDFVISTLFGDLFGVKRLAPGRLRKVSGVEHDTLKIVISHEATTFGGASGSALFAWQTNEMPAFGLHFSGATQVSNYAISTAKAADALKAIGVPL